MQCFLVVVKGGKHAYPCTHMLQGVRGTAKQALHALDAGLLHVTELAASL